MPALFSAISRAGLHTLRQLLFALQVDARPLRQIFFGSLESAHKEKVVHQLVGWSGALRAAVGIRSTTRPGQQRCGRSGRDQQRPRRLQSRFLPAKGRASEI